MSNPLSGLSSINLVVEAVDLLRRLALFLKDSPASIQERFDQLLSDIDAGSLRPSFVADVLSTLIRDSLLHTTAQLAVADDRRRFLRDIVKSINQKFGDLLRVSKTQQIYASDLKEVWIACEPMLDLVPEPDGYLETVVKVLTQKQVRYRYFLSAEKYYVDLVALLERHGVTDAATRLEFVRISEPYTPPVALYLYENRVVGFRGRGRPNLRRANDGTWTLSKPLDPGWITMLNLRDSQRHYSELTKLLPTVEAPQ